MKGADTLFLAAYGKANVESDAPRSTSRAGLWTDITYTSQTVDFKVLGGAEMFNIKRNDDGSFHVRIHQGTLIFEAIDGSYRVLARHIIRLNPGQGEMANEWRCRLIG